MKKNFYVKMYREDGTQPCDMDYNMISEGELKTLRGMVNRIKKWSIRGDVTRIEVYTYRDLFDDDTFTLEWSKEIPYSSYYWKTIENYL